MTFMCVFRKLCEAVYSDQAQEYLKSNLTLIVAVACLVVDGMETIDSAIDMLEEISQHELQTQGA